MKYFILFTAALILVSCSTEEAPETQIPEKEEVLVEIKDGIYTEWYPGKKHIKYKGGQDKERLRDGLWTYYGFNGSELSVTIYEHGLREGFTVVKYPNGTLHYRGEYHKDAIVGVWTTYDEKGKLVSEKDYGRPVE